MVARAIMILMLVAGMTHADAPASPTRRAFGVEPYLEPLVLTGQNLDWDVGSMRTQLVFGAELFKRCRARSKGIAARAGLLLGHLDIGGNDDYVLGAELGGSVPLGSFGRIGPSISLATGEHISRFTSVGLRYRYAFVTLAVEVGWGLYKPDGYPAFHDRNVFIGIGFTGMPGIANISGAAALGLAEIGMTLVPRT